MSFRHREAGNESSDGFSIEEVINDFVQPTSNAQSTSSRRNNDVRQDLIARRAVHQAEMKRLDEEIRVIEDLRRQQIQSIQDITQQIGALDERVASGPAIIQNYFDEFEWSGRLREQMRKVFGIENFRLAQEGVCNANMDGRDIICIMPTGAGKSLTYQLPATLTPGCTLVISPLVSLMRDQLLHLQENDIEGLMFTASMSNAERADAYNRLTATASSNRKEVKICYVTPERIGKSKKFDSILATMVAAKKLARIVIDEAHCVSTQGHDYRPDYKELSRLRLLYPNVPILALSATCPPDVLRDLIATLRLTPPTDGRAAVPHGTVKFTSPLYRKNLHYKVVSKPSSSAQVVRDMVRYILENHRDETGIIYCLSRADSERVASDLDSESRGQIKTGVYHAEINDKAKEELHDSWRLGRVKVICATVAFGLGIDKKDVRFVIHHSISKSVETFYQESGRAGRDGKDADCVLYYRLQDALRSPGILQDTDWERRTNGMIEFCLDFKRCRKLIFANYFSSSDWAEDNTRCGHCDNCTRDPTSVLESDVKLDARRMLTVARDLHSKKIKVTAAQLAEAARGSGQHAKLLQLSPSDRTKLSSHDCDIVIAHMLLKKFLNKLITANAYKVQVYVKPGALSRRLEEDQFYIQLPLPVRVARNNHRAREGGRAGGKRTNADVDAVEDCGAERGEEDREDAPESSSAKRRRRSSCHQHHASSSRVPAAALEMDFDPDADEDSESESEDMEWKGNLRGAPAVTHRTLRNKSSAQRKAAGVASRPSGALPIYDNEVIDISSE